jgi:hypothetical protein
MKQSGREENTTTSFEERWTGERSCVEVCSRVWQKRSKLN